MIPFDLVGAIRKGLEGHGRVHEKKLYCSSDILGSLRHAQLRLAGAPSIDRGYIDLIRLETGTMWHDRILKILADEGLAVMGEVRLSPWLPEGWGGRADWLFWDFERRCFVLGDLKTTKGEGMYYIERDGAKPDHVAQLSAYYHALVASGMPVRKRMFVCYLPLSADSDGRVEEVEPVIAPVTPWPKDDLWSLMTERWEQTQEYLEWFANDEPNLAMSSYGYHNLFINAKLAAPLARDQRMFWDKTKQQYDVKLVPDWRTKFCPYPIELCNCSEQGQTKIGHFTMTDNNEVQYVPRKGYENVIPLTQPDAGEFRARLVA